MMFLRSASNSDPALPVGQLYYGPNQREKYWFTFLSMSMHEYCILLICIIPPDKWVVLCYNELASS